MKLYCLLFGLTLTAMLNACDQSENHSIVADNQQPDNQVVSLSGNQQVMGIREDNLTGMQTDDSEQTTAGMVDKGVNAIDSIDINNLTDSAKEGVTLISLPSNIPSEQLSLAEQQAKTFRAIYSSTCMQYLTNLDELRHNLRNTSMLSDQQARPFLKNYTGSVWPVPANVGQFTLAIPDNENICIVYARALDSQIALNEFKEVFETAPSPLVATKIEDSTQDETTNDISVVSYGWQIPDASRQLLFMISVSETDSSTVGAVFTASIIDTDL